MRFDSNSYVIKRNGEHQEVSTEKIETRIHRLSKDLVVDVAKMVVKTAAGIYPGVQTSELDRLAAETAAYHSTEHPDYDKLAVRVAVSNLHRQTQRSFVETMRLQFNYVHPRSKKRAPQISEETMQIAEKYATELESAIHYERDFDYTFFGLRTLERSYLKKQNGQVIERIQHLLMRCSIGIHGDDLPAILETYDLWSRRLFTHATPTLFNSGTEKNQMSSCFLLTMDDSIENIYDTLKRCAMLSKGAGGIGLSVSRIRATGSYIEGTDGESNGLVPMLRNFNSTARYVDQCFVAGTWVLMGDGQWKAINQIKSGEQVIGKSGAACTVKEVLAHTPEVREPLVVLTTELGRVVVTSEHQFLAVSIPAFLMLEHEGRTLEQIWTEHVIPRLKSGLLEPDWLTPEQLRVGDLLCHPADKDHQACVWNGFSYSVLTGIADVVSQSYTGPLYDLEVEGDTSYVVAVGVAHNGGGKRKGAIAIYLEPWHADIEAFLLLKNNNGNEELRCRDLYYGLWMPDLFYRRVEEDGVWSLFCPKEAPGLVDNWGPKFEELYLRYENTPGLARKVMPARKLEELICLANIENAMPYILNKDHCNARSNHQHLGTITNSNLCTEIVEFSDPNHEVAVCNLATVALPMCVKDGVFDFNQLADISRLMVRNLNKVVDRNYYPIPETRNSNLAHRPIGLGVQGLHDAMLMLHLAYESPQARELNIQIFATLYYAALDESCKLAEKLGPYASYPGSPVSKGLLQFDMWGVQPHPMWPWDELRARIAKFGVRNSLLIAPPPTASTSQILGNSESFEPYTSNIYVRKVLSGTYPVVNRFLVADLSALGLWNTEMKDLIVAYKGSVQNIDTIPEVIKERYKTAWEISNKSLIDMARDRSCYIDQSHGLNVFLEVPSVGKISSIHRYTWQQGLKTGTYYFHSRPAGDGIGFSLDHRLRQKVMEKLEEKRAQESSAGAAQRAKRQKIDEAEISAISEDISPEEAELRNLEKMICTKGADCTSCQ